MIRSALHILSLSLVIILSCNQHIYADYESTILKSAPALEHRIDIITSLTAWKEQNKKDFLSTMMAVGLELKRKGKLEDALIWLQIAETYTAFDLTKREAVCSRIAGIYEKMGNYNAAFNYYMQAIEYAGSDYLKAQLYVNVAGILISIKDYNQALGNLDNAIPIFKAQKDNFWIAVAIGTKANLYKLKKDFNTAVSIDKLAYQYINDIPVNTKQLTDRQREIIDIKNIILNNIADTYLEKNEPDSAWLYLQKIQPDFKNLPFYAKAGVLVSCGEVFSQKKQNKIAAEYIEMGLDAALKAGYQDVAIKAYKELSRLYAQQGNIKKAWKNQQKYIAAKEALSANNDIHEINRLEIRYQLAKKNKEIAENQLKISFQEKEIQNRNWVSTVLLLAFTASVTIILLLQKSYKNKRKLYEQKLQNEEKGKRILKIVAGIKGEEKERTRIAKELHDGVVSEILAMRLNLKTIAQEFNGLQYSNHYRNIVQQSEEISDKIRRTAHNLMPKNIQEIGLCPSIKAFLERMSGNIKFSFQYYGNIVPLKEEAEKIIMLIILELIQNVIKHSRASEAILQLNYFDDLLSITMEDNGVGFISENATKGIGLQNLKEHAALLHATLDIQSSEYKGTTILLEIPIQEHKHEQAIPKQETVQV